MAGNRAYLDYNASAPLLPAARDTMVTALGLTGNGSSVHAEGRAVRALIEEARRSVAALSGFEAAHVVITSGATEAAATLLTPDWRMGRGQVRFSRLYVLASDHPCLLCGGRFDPQDVEVLPVRADGVVDLDALGAALEAHDRSAGPPLVAVHAANNETGVIQPVRRIGDLVKAAGGVFVVDAVQAAGRVPIDMAGDQADFLILSSHKIGGPKGAGAIVARSELTWPVPLIRGGGQEKGHRAGTENAAAVAGFGAAAREALSGLSTMGAVRTLRDRIEAIVERLVPEAVIHGRSAERLPNTTFFSIPGVKAETCQIAFDLAGVALSAGSACSSGKVGPSHVLKAMGVSDTGALRVSIGHATTEEDVRRFESALSDFMARLDGKRSAA
jgi:cysteine desulfurase